jgi:hypothetical protein
MSDRSPALYYRCDDEEDSGFGQSLYAKILVRPNPPSNIAVPRLHRLFVDGTARPHNPPPLRKMADDASTRVIGLGKDHPDMHNRMIRLSVAANGLAWQLSPLLCWQITLPRQQSK